MLLFFFLLGPVLTFGIVAGIVCRKLPSNADHYERTISLQTGLRVAVESVDYVNPHAMQLNGIAVFSRTSPKAVCEIPQLNLSFVANEDVETLFPDIDLTDGKSERRQTFEKYAGIFSPITARLQSDTGFWKIIVPRMHVPVNDLTGHSDTSGLLATTLQTFFGELLTRYQLDPRYPVYICVGEIDFLSSMGSLHPLPAGEGTTNSQATKGLPNIREPQNIREIQNIRLAIGMLYRDKNVIRFDWNFQIPAVSETEYQRFSMTLDRQSSLMTVHLKTGVQPIPCGFISAFSHAFQYFGAESLFSGEISAQFNRNDPADFTLRLKKAFFEYLDVAPYAADYTPFVVTGTVRGLQVESATFSPGHGHFEADGFVHVVDGSVEKVLFHRLVERFDLEVRPQNILDAPWGAVPFDDCCIFYRLRKDGATFYAQDPKSNERHFSDNELFMRRLGSGDEKQPMDVLFAKQSRMMTYHEILSVLAPDNAPVIPLTPGLQKIVTILPTDKESLSQMSASHLLFQDAQRRFAGTETPKTFVPAVITSSEPELPLPLVPAPVPMSFVFAQPEPVVANPHDSAPVLFLPTIEPPMEAPQQNAVQIPLHFMTPPPKTGNPLREN